MTHKLTIAIPECELGRADATMVVDQNGERFGILGISRGSLVWFPRRAQLGHRIDWETFDRFMKEQPDREKRGDRARVHSHDGPHHD